MQKTVFYISKMDCPSEEKMVRLALESNQEIKSLKFDFSERRLTVLHQSDSQKILSALVPLNYGAKLETDVEYSPTPEELEEDIDPVKEADVLKLLLGINGFMFIVEIITGLLADSMGLISDSLDMLADASVYAVSLYAVGKALSVKKRSAKMNGILQVVLGFGVLVETLRRFIFGSEPEPSYMIMISTIALVANVYCLYLLSKHKEGGVHMKASYICSSTDIMANFGVIIAGALVFAIKSSYPDLIIGLIVTFIVLRGGVSILRIAKA